MQEPTRHIQGLCGGLVAGAGGVGWWWEVRSERAGGGIKIPVGFSGHCKDLDFPVRWEGLEEFEQKSDVPWSHLARVLTAVWRAHHGRGQGQNPGEEEMAWTRMVRVEWWGWSDSRCILKVDGIRDELMDCISEAQEREVWRGPASFQVCRARKVELLSAEPGALEVKPVSQVKSSFSLVKSEVFISSPSGILSRQLWVWVQGRGLGWGVPTHRWYSMDWMKWPELV